MKRNKLQNLIFNYINIKKINKKNLKLYLKKMKKKCVVDYNCNGCGWTVNSPHPLALCIIPQIWYDFIKTL
jgi:hypothetical protein